MHLLKQSALHDISSIWELMTQIRFKIYCNVVLNCFNGVVAVSFDVKKRLVETGANNNKIRVIYNPIDIQQIITKIDLDKFEDAFYNDEDPVLISVGRLNKGHIHLLRVLRYLNNNMKKSCKLRYWGRENLRINLKNVQKRWGLKIM